MTKKNDNKKEEAVNQAANPSVKLNAQYLKDLSFENPNAPASLVPKSEAPKIDVSLNLEAKEIAKNNFEVAINISCKALSGEENIFVVEAKYAGLFTLENFNDEQKEQVLLIHCPSLLFPFARRVIADSTRDGGFQPLMIDPIDFAALFFARKEQESKEQSNN
jgi:preprotein translocase subunit SecB